MPNIANLPSSLFALILLPLGAIAGEVESPEKFMSESYGWTISGLDNERGWGGRYKNFVCFDDRLAPPANKEESSRKRFGVQCQTKRVNRENLGAMIFITWSNPSHSRPFTDQAMLEYSANQMAGNVNERNAEPRCTSEDIEAAGKKLKIYDCDMALPFGTFHASMLQFQHRELVYYIRVQNASNTPFHKEPKETVRTIAKDLVVSNQ
jgi:hypothetical protein